MPLPEEKEFERNGHIKTLERSSSKVDEKNREFIECLEGIMRLAEKGFANI